MSACECEPPPNCSRTHVVLCCVCFFLRLLACDHSVGACARVLPGKKNHLFLVTTITAEQACRGIAIVTRASKAVSGVHQTPAKERVPPVRARVDCWISPRKAPDDVGVALTNTTTTTTTIVSSRFSSSSTTNTTSHHQQQQQHQPQHFPPPYLRDSAAAPTPTPLSRQHINNNHDQQQQ